MLRTLSQLDQFLDTFDLPGTGVSFLLYRFPDPQRDNQPPDRSILINDPWACLRILFLVSKWSSAKEKTMVGSWGVGQTLDGGKTWNVPLVFTDDDGVIRSLWLKLEFEKPLPRPETWPKR